MRCCLSRYCLKNRGKNIQQEEMRRITSRKVELTLLVHVPKGFHLGAEEHAAEEEEEHRTEDQEDLSRLTGKDQTSLIMVILLITIPVIAITRIRAINKIIRPVWVRTTRKRGMPSAISVIRNHTSSPSAISGRKLPS